LHARLARAQVDEELVLEGALDTVGVTEVVDRRAARSEADGWLAAGSGPRWIRRPDGGLS
jgi:hypothetical protein